MKLRLKSFLVAGLALGLAHSGSAKEKKFVPRTIAEVVQAAADRAAYRAALSEALQDKGVSRAVADSLATDLANGDLSPEAAAKADEAAAAARVIDRVADELRKLDVPAQKITAILDQIAKGRLSNFDTSQNEAGAALVDALRPPGATAPLPDTVRRPADVAKALAKAISDLHQAGLNAGDKDFDDTLNTLLGRGLSGKPADALVRGVVKKQVDEVVANGGGDKEKSTPPDSQPSDSQPTDPADYPETPSRMPPPPSGGQPGPPPAPLTDGPPPPPEGEKKDEPAKSDGGKKERPRDVIDFSDTDPNAGTGTGATDSTLETPTERAARQKAEKEKKEKEDKEDKKDDDDDESKDGDGPPRDPDASTAPSASTSLDPGGEQAYHGKPTLRGLLDRLDRLQARRGQQSNPAPDSGMAPDRTVPIKDPKGGLLGNPGVPGAKIPPAKIDPKQVPKPGPQPGEVNPDPRSDPNAVHSGKKN